MIKYYVKILCFILLIFFGVFMIIYGEHDDSPGAQFLGLIMFIIGIVSLVKNKKNIKN